MSDLDADFCRWRYWWTRNRNKFTTTRQASVASWTAAIESGAAQEAPALSEAARDLFDNRLGWSEGRNPYAPRELWAALGAALYGADDPRVIELAAQSHPDALVAYIDAGLATSQPKGAA